MPQTDVSLFDDLDAVPRNGSPDERFDMLRRVVIEAKTPAEIGIRPRRRR